MISLYIPNQPNQIWAIKYGITRDIPNQIWDNLGYPFLYAYLWSCAWRYNRNSDGVNISTTSWSSLGRKPASMASEADRDRPAAGWGRGSSDKRVFRSLKPLCSCFSSLLRKCSIASSISSLSGLASMYSLSCGSCPEPGSDGGAGMGRRELQNPVYNKISVEKWILGEVTQWYEHTGLSFLLLIHDFDHRILSTISLSNLSPLS